MLPQPLTGILLITAEAPKHLNTQGREYKEQKKEEQTLEFEYLNRQDFFLPFYLDFQLEAVPASLCLAET